MAESNSLGGTNKSVEINKMEELSAKNAKRENELDKTGTKMIHNVFSNQPFSNITSSSRFNFADQSGDKFIFSSILRPPQLNGTAGNDSPTKPAFSLNPSRLNPFAKITNEDSNNSHNGPKDTTVPTSSNNSAPKFLPLLQNGNSSGSTSRTATASVVTSCVSSNNFVFGQNLKERVINDENMKETRLTNGSVCGANLQEDTLATCSVATANGTSDMLFSSALKETHFSDNSAAKVQVAKTLSESAREYEESRAVKRKYEEVEIKTGEEEETNVIQIMCKLFTFDKATGGSWQERGRGTLRLNDQISDEEGNFSSRLVFRTAGSLRVVLNTKIWAEMTIQRASLKSIRLTAFDSNGEIKVFLLTGNPEEIKQLQQHLEVRVNREVEKYKSQKTENLNSIASEQGTEESNN